MARFFKKNIVGLLCILAFLSPIIGNLLIDVFYYSSVFGWVIGFVFILSSLIIVTKRPDEPEGDQKV